MAFARFFASALAGKPVKILGDGAQVRDFTFVDDAVEGTIAAAHNGRPGAVYNIGGGTQVELLEALAQIEQVLDVKIEVEHLPDARGDVRRTCSDPRTASIDLGFAPRVGLEEGLMSQAAWVLAQTGYQRERVAA
jgi:nucleoside-diphosphate-sugar epimerase